MLSLGSNMKWVDCHLRPWDVWLCAIAKVAFESEALLQPRSALISMIQVTTEGHDDVWGPCCTWSHVDVVGQAAARGYTDVSGQFCHLRTWSGPTQPRAMSGSRSYCNWCLCCGPWIILPPKAMLISMVPAPLSRSMVLLQDAVVFMDCAVTRIWLEAHDPCSFWLWMARSLHFCDTYDCICTVKRYIEGSV